MLKNWFKKGSGEKDELSVDDLVVLGRLDDAEARLVARLKVATEDRHARARLGDVLGLQGRNAEAVDHYVATADLYLDDGFLDKAAALLVKASKLQPENGTVKEKLRHVEHSKLLEQFRREALDGLREGIAARGGTPTLEIETIWRGIEEGELPRHVPVTQARRLFSQLEIVRLETGRVLRRPGELAAELYVVGRGEIEVLVESTAGTTDLGVYAGGDVFGESTLFAQQCWRALYRATSPATLLRLDRGGLERVLQGNSDPKGLIDALRGQRRDAQLDESLARLRMPL